MSRNQIDSQYEKHYEKHYLSRRNNTNLACYDEGLFTYLSRNVGLDKSILDLGCGDGLKLAGLLKNGYSKLTGVDRYIAPSIHLENIIFIKSDIMDFIESSSERYDFIILSDVIEHFDLASAVELLRRLNLRLNKAGAIYIRCPNLASPFAGLYAFGDVTHKLFLNPFSIEQVANMAGLQVWQIQAELGERRLRSPLKKSLIVTMSLFWRMVYFLVSISVFRRQIVLTPNMNVFLRE